MYHGIQVPFSLWKGLQGNEYATNILVLDKLHERSDNPICVRNFARVSVYMFPCCDPNVFHGISCQVRGSMAVKSKTILENKRA
jgi:hypothetical protein